MKAIRTTRRAKPQRAKPVRAKSGESTPQAIRRYYDAEAECNRIKAVANFPGHRCPVDFSFQTMLAYMPNVRGVEFGIGIGIKSKVGTVGLDDNIWDVTADTLRRVAHDLIRSADRLNGDIEPEGSVQP